MVSVVRASVSMCHHGTQVMIDRHFGDIGSSCSAGGVGSGDGVDDAAAFASLCSGNRVIGGLNDSPYQIASSVVMTIIARSLGEDEIYSAASSSAAAASASAAAAAAASASAAAAAASSSSAAAAGGEMQHVLRSNSSSVPSRSQFFTEAEREVTLGEFDAFMSATDRR